MFGQVEGGGKVWGWKQMFSCKVVKGLVGYLGFYFILVR